MKKNSLKDNGDRTIKKRISEIINKSTKKFLIVWACDCVDRVLPFFEDKYPEDYRPRKALGTARAWSRGEASVSDARSASFAAHAAARDAKAEGEEETDEEIEEQEGVEEEPVKEEIEGGEEDLDEASSESEDELANEDEVRIEEEVESSEEENNDG